MPQSTDALGTDESIRAEVAAETEKNGVAPTARAYGVSRAGLMGYLAGRAHLGTRVLIQTVHKMRKDGKIR